jgi:hypothetical protein
VRLFAANDAAGETWMSAAISEAEHILMPGSDRADERAYLIAVCRLVGGPGMAQS